VKARRRAGEDEEVVDEGLAVAVLAGSMGRGSSRRQLVHFSLGRLLSDVALMIVHLDD